MRLAQDALKWSNRFFHGGYSFGGGWPEYFGKSQLPFVLRVPLSLIFHRLREKFHPESIPGSLPWHLACLGSRPRMHLQETVNKYSFTKKMI